MVPIKINKKLTGEKINKLLYSQKLTQEKLAGLIFASPRTVLRWVNGERLISLEYAIAICRVFNVNLDDFIVYEIVE